MAAPAGPAPFRLLLAAFADTERLLGGPGGRRRWRELAFLAILAGLVGPGIQPPPLGLLEPVLADPELRSRLARDLRPQLPLLVLLAALLAAAAASVRPFVFAFLAGLMGRAPAERGFRRHLRAGLAHFAWSSALTLPLYALLFWGESRVAAASWRRLLNAGEAEAAEALLDGLLQFLLVLLPWALVTLPAMVTMYELTPAAMLRRRRGPAAACGWVLRAARTRPGLFAGYLGLRLALQVGGSAAAAMALLPAAAGAAIPGALLLGAAWLGAAALGGPGGSAGAAVLGTAGALLLALLYALLCAIVLPVTAAVNSYALRLVAGWEEAECPVSGPTG